MKRIEKKSTQTRYLSIILDSHVILMFLSNLSGSENMLIFWPNFKLLGEQRSLGDFAIVTDDGVISEI